MTFDDVARHFGVRRCNECLSRYNHRAGARVANTIHFADRTFTRAGLRNFLMLVAETRLIVGPEKWRKVWAYNVWAASVARKELHITIPARLSDADRAYVRWRIQTASDVPTAARTWANRKETTHGNRI